jgi:tetratricopeptide (TPR) repeat protein
MGATVTSCATILALSGFLVAQHPPFVADYPRMPGGIASPVWKRTAAAIATVAAVWFCYAGGKHALASHYAASTNFQDWERATRIEPDNPETWYRLGRFRQIDFDNEDLPLAISYYRRALQINPNSPYYKLDLASALETAGNNDEADREFQAAQAAYPVSAEVSWKYGNFLLRRNRLPEAYAQIHHAVVADPTRIPLAISRVWHSDPDVHLLLDQVLPDTPEGYSDAVAFLAGEQNPTAAAQAWNRLVAKDPHTDWKRSFVLTDMLVAQEKFDQAEAVWRQAVAMDAGTASGYSGNSLVYNGGFERDIADGGFGWRLTETLGVDFDYDPDEKHSGSRSGRLTFDGSKNLSYVGLSQFVLVAPGTRYRFQGFLRTDQISTESGIRFEILDPKNPKDLDVFTTNETGTIPWTMEQAEFTTGPQTHMIAVRVARKPSERLDNKIRGSAWLDDVSLAPVGSK